ncbi:DUF2993 domain-containing protein [Sporohalobacter salinus]|uniref:LmeA family phospholipid-binding protein n=1 Tax=Sporohalobacter salinus TaxID=1494606 RepID=UPI00195F4F8E|nr:DUF2993 domain-containing protein [Sporohalobacter salinus]MBM7624156.1 hypothetical protein [Sporohalobacter salinus]
MKKLIGFIVILLLISQLVLPVYFSQQLEKSLSKKLESSQSLKVEVSSFPALLMLTGRFQRVDLKGKELVVDRLRVAELEAKFSNIKLKSTPDKEKGSRFVGDNKRLKLTFTEEDLENYLADRLSSLQNIILNLGPKQTTLSGDFDLFGNRIKLKLGGKFKLETNQKLSFIPQDLMVAELRIPREIIKELMSEINLTLDLTKLPVPLQADKIKIKQDKLMILGGVKEENV